MCAGCSEWLQAEPQPAEPTERRHDGVETQPQPSRCIKWNVNLTDWESSPEKAEPQAIPTWSSYGRDSYILSACICSPFRFHALLICQWFHSWWDARIHRRRKNERRWERECWQQESRATGSERRNRSISERRGRQGEYTIAKMLMISTVKISSKSQEGYVYFTYFFSEMFEAKEFGYL